MFGASKNARVRSLLLPATLGLLAACEAGERAPARDPGKTSDIIGNPAPAFDLPAQAGGSRASLDAARGHVVIVDFWATWCAPCKESFPRYQELVDRFDGELAVIGISVDDEPDEIASFAKETGVSFPLAWDRDKSVARSYEPPSMPTSFLVDREGIVRRVHQGYHRGDEDLLAREVRHLLE